MPHTIIEEALAVEVPEQKVYYLLRKGKIKGFKRKCRWIILREEVSKKSNISSVAKGTKKNG